MSEDKLLQIAAALHEENGWDEKKVADFLLLRKKSVDMIITTAKLPKLLPILLRYGLLSDAQIEIQMAIPKDWMPELIRELDQVMGSKLLDLTDKPISEVHN